MYKHSDIMIINMLITKSNFNAKIFKLTHRSVKLLLGN